MADLKRKLVSGLYNWTILGIIFASVIVINIICSFWYARFDVTEDKRYSLSESTIEFLENAESFKGRINIQIYLAGNLPAELEHFRSSIEDKLKEFRVYAGDRIEYTFIDPKKDSDAENSDAKRFDNGNGVLPMEVTFKKNGTESKMELWPGAIIQYGGAASPKTLSIQLLPGTKAGRPYNLEALDNIIENSTRNLEYMLMSGLRRIIQDRKPNIGFLQGHGELKWQETQRARAMIKPYYSISDVSLNDSVHALDPYDGLIIARPRSKFSQKDLYLIDQFVMKGGKLMCFVDQLYLPEDSLELYGQSPTVRLQTGIDKLLFDYGIKLHDHYVMDGDCLGKPVRLKQASLIPWFFHVMATPTSHSIAKNVDRVALEYTGEIKKVPTPGVKFSPILTTSTNSTVSGIAPEVNFLIPLQYGNQPLTANPKSNGNKRCVSAVLEGKFQSYFKNRIVSEFIDNPDSKYLNKSKKGAKVLVVANGRFIQNRYDSTLSPTGNSYLFRPKQDVNDLKQDPDLVKAGQRHVFGNQEFFQNLTDFMMGEEGVLETRSKQIDFHEMDKDKVIADSDFYKLMNLGLPILIILALAFVMNFIRKRKYAR